MNSSYLPWWHKSLHVPGFVGRGDCPLHGDLVPRESLRFVLASACALPQYFPARSATLAARAIFFDFSMS